MSFRNEPFLGEWGISRFEVRSHEISPQSRNDM